MNSGPPDGPSRSRRLGIYYTPDEVAAAVVNWALPQRRGSVLDPSFGGCGLLRAALDLPTNGEAVSVFGVDVDPAAQEYAKQLRGMGVPADNLRLADFFSVDADAFGQSFDAVVGNPPYIRHHWYKGNSRLQARAAAEAAGVVIPGRADAWTYFVAHSMQFLDEGGRLALLLPLAALYADYAGPLWEHVARRFSSVRLIEVADRLFPDAMEATVILAAAGHLEGGGEIRVAHATKVADLDRVLAAEPGVEFKRDRREWTLRGLPQVAQSAWRDAIESDSVRPLGDLATIRIGVVTGANRFFLREKANIESLLQPSATSRPVVSRATDLHLARLTARDINALRDGGREVDLLWISANGKGPLGALQEEITAAEADGIHERYHCARREPWYVLTEAKVPSAFLPYMGARPPRPILNDSDATSTNTIHRLWWKVDVESPESIVVGAWTSLYALGAEAYGRRYGGGVLKLEPSEAAIVPVPVVAASADIIDELDLLIRQHKFGEATRLADRRVLVDGLGLAPSVVAILHDTAGTLKARRSMSERFDG